MRIFIDGRIPITAIAVTATIAIAASLISLSSGIYIIFQNLFYVPIIIACIFYRKRGLIFSVILALLYLAMLLFFAGLNELENGVIRMLLFIVIASVITVLSENTKDAEEKLRTKNDELIAANAELKKSRDRYFQLFEGVNDSIFLHKINSDGLPGKLMEVNGRACTSLNYSYDELCSLTVMDIAGENGKTDANRYMPEILKTGDFTFESSHKRHDGTTFPVEVNAHLIKTEENGNFVLSVVRDISTRKIAEDALKEVNKKINLLSSITRHDILNQITGAAGYLELIELDNEIVPGSKTEEYLKKISGAIETINKQITFTGYYKDLGEQAPDWFDVGKIIDNMGKTSSFDGIEIQNQINGVKVFADPLFEKVIYNLIDNAIKHGEKITEISFYTKTGEKELIIICEDDGIGIPDEAKEKIFRREYYKNSGLGLFLSREILAITGITITETGKAGEGAKFEIHVPNSKFRTE